MNKSHIVQEQQKYLAFDSEGNTQLVSESKLGKQGYSYRKVHYTIPEKYNYLTQDLPFKDPDWPIENNDFNMIDSESIIFKRLVRLYSRKYRPNFFQQDKNKSTNQLIQKPDCLHQMGIFNMKHYKQMFITQTIQDNGIYAVVVNQDGRFQTVTVDDSIPVYEKSGEPIWGFSALQPWKLILLKVWAKKKKGYEEIKNSRPFEFIEYFSNSNWKFYNLSNSGQQFLKYYTNKYRNGFIILKTKQSMKVKDVGLIPNSSSYILRSLHQITNGSIKEWHLIISSVQKHKWTGNLSIVDDHLNSIYSKQQFPFRLEYEFMLNSTDFLNNFSAAYITSIRSNGTYYSNYYRLKIPPLIKQALFLSFQIFQQGFLDFTIKQFQSNKKKPNTKSRLNINQNQHTINERFLKCQYILIKKIQKRKQQQLQSQLIKIKKNTSLIQGSKSSKIEDKLLIQSQIKDILSNENKIKHYNIHNETYEIQYQRGYNRGTAHFIRVVPGQYILRLRSQNNDKLANYVVHYCCNSPVKMNEIILSQEDSRILMRDAYISIANKSTYLYIKDTQQVIIYLGNTFEDTGYGHLTVSNRPNNKSEVIFQIDPKKMRINGYKLKHQYKKQQQIFTILIKPGESTAIILKKIQNISEYKWPPSQAYRVWYKK